MNQLKTIGVPGSVSDHKGIALAIVKRNDAVFLKLPDDPGEDPWEDLEKTQHAITGARVAARPPMCVCVHVWACAWGCVRMCVPVYVSICPPAICLSVSASVCGSSKTSILDPQRAVLHPRALTRQQPCMLRPPNPAPSARPPPLQATSVQLIV